MVPGTMKCLAISSVLLFCLSSVSCSVGENTPFFRKCFNACLSANCTSGGYYYLPELNYEEPLIDKMLMWRCVDECQYRCMWKTVEAFKQRNWETPQFFGKWPFIRMYGMQEPGSVIGSILNFLSHITNFLTLRRHVSKNHPMFWLWRIFYMVSANAWLWSTLFHTRDLEMTEFLDYTFAFAMVLVLFYCFGMRVLYGKPKYWGTAFTAVCVAYFANHVYYLFMQKINYEYNMLANIAAGTLGGVGWIVWCCVQWWRGRRYVWRCMVFVMLSAVSVILELSDFPPKKGIWDSHAIWHVATAPLPFFFYRFIIDDCKVIKKKVEK